MSNWDNLNFKKAESAPTHDFKTSPKFIGKLVRIESGVGSNESMLYTFEVPTADGKTELKAVWGSTVLDTRLKNVKIGEIVKIEFLGKEKSKDRKGATYNNFDVFHAAEDDVDPNQVFDGKAL